MTTTTNHPIPLPTLRTLITTTLPLPTATPTLTRNPSIEGDDHMIYHITESPTHLVRVTKPRPNRPLPGHKMQALDIAIRKHISAQYRARGLSAAHIPISVAARVLSEDGVYAASVETKLPGVGLHRVKPTEET
ncbi:hypothetical protein BBP40_007226, partial [Aspergillus hancockii]